MKKIFFAFIFVNIFTLQLLAQSDSISLFRAPGKSGVKSSDKSVGSNLFGISLGHLSRGGTVLSYEKLLGTSGISIYAGLGISLIDIWGQYSISKERSILFDNFSEVKNIDIGMIFDVGAKYYFEKQTGGFFIGTGFTSINNTIYTGYDFAYEYKGSISNSTIKLNYTSNEIKFILGHVNSQNDKFYNEFSFGPQFRFLEYNQVQYQFGSSINGIRYTATKEYIEEVKVGLFLGWKIGFRF